MKECTAILLAMFCLGAPARAADVALQEPARLLEQGRFRQAEELLRKVVARQPDNAEAHQLLGDAYRSEAEGPMAEREYRRAIALGRRNPELFQSLATVEKWDRHFSDARNSYRAEIEMAPDNREARSELDDLRLQRGATLFGAYGGWETDSTARGWQTELAYRGLDKVDAYVGAAYADKFFYTRQSTYGRAYLFFSPTGYVELSLGEKNYNYPVAKNPVPDANAYRNVPSISVEVGDQLRPNLQLSVSYEFFRPNFFFAPGDYANNNKVGAELSYRTAWKPLQLRLMSAVLRDPDPDRTVVDKINRRVTVAYGTQYLVGGGAALSLRRLDAELLLLPNRDLDRSTDYSVLAQAAIPVRKPLTLRTGYIFDHYSASSLFSGQTAQIVNLGFSWRALRWLELTAGTKTIRRPIQNDQAFYITTSLGLPLR